LEIMMTVTMQIRTGWPIEPVKFLDAVTIAIGADPRTIARHAERQSCENAIAGNRALLGVEWVTKGRPRRVWNHLDGPEAYVVLTADGASEILGEEVLPAARAFLNGDLYRRLGDWWWHDDFSDTWHVGESEFAL
jgi:hypothetical protein